MLGARFMLTTFPDPARQIEVACLRLSAFYFSQSPFHPIFPVFLGSPARFFPSRSGVPGLMSKPQRYSQNDQSFTGVSLGRCKESCTSQDDEAPRFKKQVISATWNSIETRAGPFTKLLFDVQFCELAVCHIITGG